MRIGETFIDDTYAEAFGMRYTRLIVTAHDDCWLGAATRELCGYGASVIACDAEVGVERSLTLEESPDGRPAAAVLAFGFSTDALAKALANRVGQCVMTCPTTAVYNGLPHAPESFPLGKKLRFFGDGYQKSKVIAGRRFWRVPVMDGEFVVEDTLGWDRGVAGGNIILQGIDLSSALAGARRASESLANLPECITPFPGGVARSGSKVGSRYKGLLASTAVAFCPTLRGRVESKLHPQTTFAYEIVIDGISQPAVERAMRVAMQAASGPGIVSISAGNYGGKLGKFLIPLRSLMTGDVVNNSSENK